MSQKNFLKKRVFVTGETSDIGIYIGKEFYLQGEDIVLSDHPMKEKKLQLYGEKLKAFSNGKIDFMPLDISKIQDIKETRNIECDILINCAGNNNFKPLLEVEETDWNMILDTNLKGTFFLTQKVVNNMIKNEIKGRIVNIGSQHGVVANGLRAPYCISKFGLIGFTKVAALELAQYGILVNCVSPTYVLTNKSENFLMTRSVQMDYLPRIPLHKYARPMDIARAVLFLCEDSNQMITGENIMVDGGYTIY